MIKLLAKLSLIFFLGITLSSYAQSADESLVKIADEMYDFGSKKDALAVYLQAIEVNPDNVRANYMAGKCYLETVGKELSVTYLIKAYQLKPDITPDLLFKIGNGFQLGGKFNDAIKYYELYKQSLNDTKAKALKSSVKDEVIKTDRKIFECQNGSNYYTNINHFRIENIKDVVNSEYPDYVPTISADQSTMIFTSRRAGGVGKFKDVDNEYFEDIWISKKDANGEWGYPENLGEPINTESHDANIGLSADGKELFIRKPENGGDIFVTNLKPDGKWAVPVSLGTNINSKYDEPSVSISTDGKTLYFSSDRPGGFGGFDIYKSQLDKNGKWGKPQNLGSMVNTEYDEDAPFIDFDSKTLYFSSRGLNGMGGYDIYKSIYDSTKKSWGEPQNMGYPVNSPDEDIYFVIAGDGKTGYFASAKGDGFGDKDIYKIYFDEPKKDTTRKDTIAKTPPAIKDTTKTLPPPVTNNNPKTDTVKTKEVAPIPVAEPVAKKEKIKQEEVEKPAPTPKAVPIKKEVILYPTIISGSIYDQKTNAPLSCKLTVNDLKGNVISEVDVANDGTFSTTINTKVPTKYLITVNKEGYIYANININIPANAKVQKTLNRDIALKKVAVGQVFILRNIYFDFDKANIKKESFPYLDNLTKWLKTHPEVSLEIGGHTDNLGLEDYNKILSQRRVDAIMRYLTAKGIRPERLTAIGYGEERPLASNDDEAEGREINRRTEFKIVK
jgi:outer membrane protein OmpA-like peptidoglycan-associated protein